MPATRKRSSRGAGPSGVGAPPIGEISTSVSPTRSRNRFASSAPTIRPGRRSISSPSGLGSRSASEPARIVCDQLRRLGHRARVDALQHDRLQLAVAAAQDRVGGEERRRAHDARHLLHALAHVEVVRVRALAREHREVRARADDLLLPHRGEAVHHRQHDRDHRDAERDADHADHRDDRDEGLPAARDQVAQRDEPLDRARAAVLDESREHERPDAERGEQEQARGDRHRRVSRRPRRLGTNMPSTNSAPQLANTAPASQVSARCSGRAHTNAPDQRVR